MKMQTTYNTPVNKQLFLKPDVPEQQVVHKEREGYQQALG